MKTQTRLKLVGYVAMLIGGGGFVIDAILRFVNGWPESATHIAFSIAILGIMITGSLVASIAKSLQSLEDRMQALEKQMSVTAKSTTLP